MSTNCRYLKIKLNKKLECKLSKKEICFRDCKNCKYKEYKISACKTEIKRKSSKLGKLERERFSLFSTDKSKCYFCTSNYHLTWHEIFGGRNRPNSMKYGLCLRMCMSCHMKYQNDKDFNKLWHKKGQIAFNKNYKHLSFEEIFKSNYL